MKLLLVQVLGKAKMVNLNLISNIKMGYFLIHSSN